MSTSTSFPGFLRDTLPYVFHMLHPSVTSTNPQLFSPFEKTAFLTSLQLLILHDLKLKPFVDQAEEPKQDSKQ